MTLSTCGLTDDDDDRFIKGTIASNCTYCTYYNDHVAWMNYSFKSAKVPAFKCILKVLRINFGFKGLLRTVNF